MSKPKKNNEDWKIAPATSDEVAQFGGSDAEPVSPAAPEAAGSPADELAALRAEVADLRDKLLRAKADAINAVRRVTEEKSQSLRMANASFARDLLAVVDNLERTLASMQSPDPDDPLLAGVKLTYELLLKTLRQHHVEPIQAVGRPFDPAFHEALLHSDSTDVPEGHVAAEMVKGYRMHDQVLRAAVVAVARRSADREHASAQPGADAPEIG